MHVCMYTLKISTQEWKWKQLSAFIEANRMKRSQIKWKLLLFDESYFFFLLKPVYILFSFIRAMLFILSQIKKHVFF